MPSATVFLLTAGCSASADVLSALLTVEKPPPECHDAYDFNTVLAHTCYWVPESTDSAGRVVLSHDDDDAGDSNKSYVMRVVRVCGCGCV